MHHQLLKSIQNCQNNYLQVVMSYSWPFNVFPFPQQDSLQSSAKRKRIILASIKFAWLCSAYKVIYIFGMELCSVISAITVCNIDGIDFDCKFGLKICHFAR